jgi:hypothetical protein
MPFRFNGASKSIVCEDDPCLLELTSVLQKIYVRNVTLLDAVFTDPPYFGNIQYAELMDFCYAWLRRLIGRTSHAFSAVSTRNPDELTGNVDMGRGRGHFTEGLSAFVCRSTGTVQRKWLADSPEEVARIVKEDLDHLRAGNVKPTHGDIRCVTYGHLIRLAIWSLRLGWNKNEPTTSRIAKVADWLQRLGQVSADNSQACTSHQNSYVIVPVLDLNGQKIPFRHGIYRIFEDVEQGLLPHYPASNKFSEKEIAFLWGKIKP